MKRQDVNTVRGARVRCARSGFTLIELLVTIGIIAVLIGILTVALGHAMTGGRRAATEQLLGNISVAVEQFNADFGYYPPLMHDKADGAGGGLSTLEGQPVSGGHFPFHEARYKSILTLGVYLVGMGDLNDDMLDDDRDDGKAGPGFRDPGRDRSWGGAEDRMDHKAAAAGRVFGPYLAVADTSNFRAVKPEDFHDNRGEIGAEPADYEDGLKDRMFVLVDRWDKPIRYYKDWPTKKTRDSEASNRSVSTLEGVPIELVRVEAIEAMNAISDLNPADDPDLLRVPYALQSSGADEMFVETDYGSQLNVPFLFGRMVDGNDNSTGIRSIITDENTSFGNRFRDSLRDNVRVTP